MAKKRGRTGVKHPQVKLTNKAVKDILYRVIVLREPQGDVAARYQVAKCTVSSINTGRLWKHIPRDCYVRGEKKPKKEKIVKKKAVVAAPVAEEAIAPVVVVENALDAKTQEWRGLLAAYGLTAKLNCNVRWK